jgi:hypothetical protein
MSIRLFFTALMIAAIVAVVGMASIFAKAVTHDNHAYLSEMIGPEGAARVTEDCGSSYHPDVHCQVDQGCLDSSCSCAVHSVTEIMAGSGDIGPFGTPLDIPKKPPKREFAFASD